MNVPSRLQLSKSFNWFVYLQLYQQMLPCPTLPPKPATITPRGMFPHQPLESEANKEQHTLGVDL